MSGRHPSVFEADSSQESEPQLQVVVHAGPLAGKGFPIRDNKITFGRDPDNDISWDDNQVSRRHAQLVRQGGLLILEDLGSTNGTRVNGKLIEEPHTLQPADIISIGTSIFGVKGFTAPSTAEMTQVSPQRLVYPSSMATPAPAASPKPAPSPKRSSSTGSSMFVIGGVLALIVVVLILAGVTAYFLTQESEPPVTQLPTVVITAPANGSQHQLNLPVTVQTTASDPSGVIRIELWVDGAKTAEAVSPASQGQPTLTASLQWVPLIPGSHTLEIRAYNVQERVNEPVSVLVNAVGNSPTNTPTVTVTPEPPTATVPAIPSLTTLADLNVRAGPGTDYEFVGLLLSGKETEIIGRDENAQWWQIRFDPAPDGVGWVIAGPSFSTVINADGVPVVSAPGLPTDTPTATPSATPIPPTETPTATSIPSTDTPTATVTPTATEAIPQAELTISPTVVQGGECVNVTWNVIEVKEVYFQGEGVPGVGGRQECPNETTIYRLRIVNLDGSERVVDETVEVINPVVSAGTITIDPGQTIDFDEGIIPGDDFTWNVNGSSRLFEVLAGVNLSPQGQFTLLGGLTLEICASPATAYNQYTFIDGSDVIANPANALTAGRTACYHTNQGRLGKLRFQQYSTQSLTIEWLTWK